MRLNLGQTEEPNHSSANGGARLTYRRTAPVVSMSGGPQALRVLTALPRISARQ